MDYVIYELPLKASLFATTCVLLNYVVCVAMLLLLAKNYAKRDSIIDVCPLLVG